MNQKLTSRSKKKIKAKIASAFSGEIKSLSADFRGILLEDMVTAFENRLNVLNRAQTNSMQCYVEVTKKVEYNPF